MATMQELESALVKADAAGNADDARQLAAAIRQMRSASTVPAAADFSGVRSRVMREQDAPAGQLDPTTDMSGGERFLAGIGKSFADTGRGLYQAGVDSLARTVNPVGAILANVGAEAPARALARNVTAPLERKAQQLRAESAERRQGDSALTNTGAGLAGNITGAAAQLLGPGIVARGTAAAGALLPTTITGNALQGLALGYVQPYADDNERVTNTALGGLLGGAGGTLPRVVGGARSALANLRAGITPAEQRAGAIVLREATNPNALNFEQSAVPGVTRTTGEATLDPGVMALEDQMRASRGDVFRGIDSQNNLRRVEALQQIAGTDADMAAAQAARSGATASARAQAMQAGPVGIANTVDVIDSGIANAEGRPAVQKALQDVRRLLVSEQEAAPGLVTTAQEPRIHVLDNVRQTIGDMLEGKYGGESAAALRGSRELLAVRDALNQEIGDQVPAFTRYLDAYRQASRPINRMQVGQELLDRGAGQIPDTTGVRTLSPNAFSRATNDLDAIAQRATGFDKARAADILSPSDIASIHAVQDDLARQAARSRSAAGGSQTAGRQAIAERTMRQAVAGKIPFAGPVIEAIDRTLQDATQEKLAYLLANPNEAKRVLSALNASDSAALRKTLNQLAVATARPTQVALSNRGEQQAN